MSNGESKAKSIPAIWAYIALAAGLASIALDMPRWAHVALLVAVLASGALYVRGVRKATRHGESEGR